MKILLIVEETFYMDRLGILYLSYPLKRFNYDVKLAVFAKEGFPGIEQIMQEYSPDIVGYSMMTGEYNTLNRVNKYLKNKFNFLSVFGGPHPTFYPDLIKESHIDAICVGEGDIAFAEFCRRVKESDKYWQTPGFYVKHNGNIFSNPLLSLVKDLDQLSFPDRKLMYEAQPDVYEDGTKVFISSRGCPYSCSYCFNKKYNDIYKNKSIVVRHRSPNNVIQEIDATKQEYGLRHVFFLDDIFTIKPKGWVEEFSTLYKQKIDLPFSCHVRANLVSDSEIKLLKNAGLNSVLIGIECGDERVSNEVLNRNLSNKIIFQAIQILKKHDIKIWTHNLLGIPVKDSFEVGIKTLDMNLKIRPVYAHSGLLFPYPGTEIRKQSLRNNFLNENSVFFETHQKYSVFNFNKKEKSQIERLHYLFGLTVRFPFLRKIIRLLVKIPLSGFYFMIFYVWYGYNLKFKFFPMQSWTKEIKKYVKLGEKILKKHN
ncbi:MAG: radical SAM protein [Candidatus Omnitrophota bacterium]